MQHDPLQLRSLLEKYLKPGDILGIIGVGDWGERIRQTALETGREVRLCDPARAMLQSEEEWNDICSEWGNGMGGCTYSREEYLTFLPPACLLRNCRVVTVQIAPPEKLIDSAFVQQLRPDAVVLNFSGPEIVKVADHRIINV